MPKKSYIAFVYGTDQDKQKMLVLAGHRSLSDFLKQKVNEMYAEAFGDTPPELLIGDNRNSQ